MMDRRAFLGTLAGGLLAAPLAAGAQQTQTIPRIGFLTAGSPSSIAVSIAAFQQGLRDLGYVEGRTIGVEYRYGEGKTEQLPGLVAELAQQNPAVIVVAGATATRAATRVTKGIPLVMTNVTDPVGLGFVASLARPGGNLTGVSNLSPELGRKRLERLREIVPQLTRVAVLGDPSSPSHAPQWRETESAAQLLGVAVQSVEVREPNPDFAGAFAAITRYGAEALMTLSQPLIVVHRKQIVDFSATRRMPAMFHTQEFSEAGGLMSYGPNVPDLYRRAAFFVDRILKGAKPADLPVEQPTRFELVINLKTAKALGLTVPPSLLQRADQVIE
jgi:putative ABC transport system substrate-binding protein